MKLHIKKALAVLISAVMIITTMLLPNAAFGATFKKADNSNKYVEGEIIAVLNETASAKYMKAADVKTSYGSSFSQKDAYTFGTNNKTRTVVLKSKTLTTEQMLKQVRKNGAVKYAFPNYIKHISTITDDTYGDYQWALDNTGINGFGDEAIGKDTNAGTLWSAASAAEGEQVVAIVDTGIDYEHEDLKDVVWNNPYGKKLIGKHGMDFTGEIKDGEPYDNNGHGSHCAGIIAATANNQKGISGINASNVKIMALKFLDGDGSGSTDGALAAYDYLQRAIKLGTNVIACNNSWGGGGDFEELELFNSIFDELGELGCITFAAAGNESYNLDTDPEDDSFYIDVPAMSTSPYCVTVAASNENDDLADFSNYGAKTVDVAAPGTDILSSVSYNCFNPTIYTAAQKTELCKYIQDYNDENIGGEFGEPTQVAIDSEYFKSGVNSETSFVDGFGLDGKALQIKFTDALEEDESALYAYEIPFTLDDEDQPYSISIVAKGNKAYEMPIYDVPADVSAKDALEKSDYCLFCWGNEKDNYWDHSFAEINPADKNIDYKKGKDRKLVILVAAFKDTVVTIDDLAISKQGANADAFGKYDFYNGTSMATPYATGAAALIKNANPDASTLDIVNIIKNTGRHSAYLEGKTETEKVLSLDSIDKMPPLITSVAYNEAGEIEVKGSFKDTTKVKINDTEVEFTNPENGTLIIADNNYSTNKITVNVENAFDSDSYTTLVSNKTVFPITMLDSAPDTFGAMAVPAGEKIFFVGPYGTIGTAQYYDFDESYAYYDIGAADLTKIFEGEMNTFTSVVYYNGNLYMTALNYIQSPRTSYTIGYETALVKHDLTSGTTTKIADVPDAAYNAASLAVYNGDIYLIGGFDYGDTNKCSDKVFKLEGDTFVEQTAKLPEGRGGARFLQYKDKLVGMYGYNDNGTIPGIITFDGTEWKESAVQLTSDDYEYEIEFTNGIVIRTFNGNLGYGEGGIFANGSYVYGVGDSFTYDVDKDEITPCEYTAKNSLGDTPLIGSTVPGAFIAFPVNQSIISEDDDLDIAVGALSRVCGTALDDIADGGVDFGDDFDDEAPTQTAYTMHFNNVYPTVNTFDIEHGYAVSPMDYYFNYGDKVTVNIKSDAGYAVTKIYANDKVIATNSQTADFTISELEYNISNRSKLVASHIAGLKVSAIKGSTYTLSWNKAKTGAGYQVQQYVKGKWKTVKTIKNLNTTSYKATVKSGAAKFRVRAYGTFNSKTIYGAAQTKEIYIPKKQAVKSVSGAKGAFTVKYNKDTKATGYEIQYSTNKNFTKATTVKVTKSATVSKKVSKLAKGKYYVRVRSYKTIDGKTIYGAYSGAKSVSVK